MTRRYVLKYASGYCLALIAMASDFFSRPSWALFGKVPVTITIFSPGQPAQQFRLKASRGTPLSTLLNRLTVRGQTRVAIGRNPAWTHPDDLVGEQVLQISGFRNSELPEDPTFPSQAIANYFWMIFSGPANFRAHSRTLPLPAHLLVHYDRRIDGPTASVNTTHVDWSRTQGNESRRCGTQYVLSIVAWDELPRSR